MLTLPIARGFLSPVANASGTALPNRIYEDILSVSTPFIIKRVLIELALFTALRRGELVGLKWSDIDFEKQQLTVKRSIYKPKGENAIEKEPKTLSSIRTISIPNCLCETLQYYKKKQAENSLSLGERWKNLDYLFTDEFGNVMNPQTPTKQFSKFLERHNIRHLIFHCLRHTSATLLLSGGCDIKTVSARLGHSSIETTNIYVHAIESIDRIAAIMSDFFA